MKTKKQKILAGILIPTSTLLVAAGAAAGIVVGLNSNKSTVNYLNPTKITFSAGEGELLNSQYKEVTVEAGTKLDRIDQPSVRANKANKTFAGWVDETGHPVYGQAAINKDTKLHAVYNDDSDEYVTVNFALDQKGPTLQGNLNVSVNKGYFFFMVNRPSAKWIVTDGSITKTKYFKGWRFEDGSMIQENQVIDTNVTLYPVFTEAVTVKWDAVGFNDTESGKEPPAGKGKLSRGQDYTTLETGTIFDLFNQPGIEYEYSGEHTDNAYFAGWYYDTEGKSPAKPSDVITEDVTVHAKWSKDPDVGEQYGTLEFSKTPRSTDVYGKDLPTGMTFGYTPTDKIVVVLNTRKWADTNKPTLLCYNKDGSTNTDYKVDHWEIKTGTDTWEELSGETAFTNKTNVVRPVLTYAIDSISVYGASTINVEETKQYYVQVIGGASSAANNVTWELVTDLTGKTQFPQGIAKIDATGKVTVNSVTRTLWEQYNYTCFYVKATSTLDTTKTSYLKVNIDMPYNNNNYIWIHTVDSDPTNPKWYHSNIDDWCDTSKSYVTTTGMDGSTRTFSKTDKFNDTLTFGTNLSSVPDNFLKGWSKFSGAVDFAHSNIVTIGENFMAGCTSFNNLIINLNGIKVIKANFLKGCTSYNKPIEFIPGAALVDVGDNFLGGCTSFNSKITFPTINPFYIENNFLYGCTSYNQPLELPNIVLYVGAFFMCQCNNFTSKLTVNCPMDGFVDSEGTLASTDSNAYIHTVGFTVDGTQSDNFRKVYKTCHGPTLYRTVNDKEWDGEVTSAQFTAGKDKLAAAYNVTVSFGSDQILKYNAATSANATDWSVVNMVWNNVNTYIVKDPNKNNAELQYDASGNFKKTIATGAYGSPERVINLVHKTANIDTLYPGSTWKLDTTNKWYEYDFNTTESSTTYNNKVILRFSRYTKEIEYIGWYYKLPSASEWDYHILAYVDNIEKTATIPVPTKVHNNTASWNSTNNQYTATDTTAVSTGANSGFSFKIESGQFTEMPNAFSAWVYTTDATKGLAGSFNTDLGARAHLFSPSGKIKNITTKFDTTTYKIKISCDQAFEVGDVIYVTTTGPFDANTKFIAAPMYTIDFTTCPWSTIITWCNKLENGDITAEEFCAVFDNGISPITSMDGFVGLERTVSINNLKHRVKVIGTQHDTISDGETYAGQKAALTFFTMNLLSCESNGAMYKSLAGSGQDYLYSTDYPNSQLRKNLTGEGDAAAVSWSSHTSETKTALEMITEPNFASNIKKVNKTVGISTNLGYTWTATTYDDKLFPMSMTELAQTPSAPNYNFTVEGTAYKYWQEHKTYSDYKILDFRNYSSEMWTRSGKNVSGSSLTNYDRWNWTFSANISTPFVSEPSGIGLAVAFGFCI